MEILINKKIEIKDANKSIIDYCKNNLVLTNPNYVIAEKLGKNTKYMERYINIYAKNGNDYILPFGCLQSVYKLCPIDDLYKIEIHLFIGNNLKGNINLYDYQRRAVDVLKRGKNGVLEAPCGSGKTQIGLALIKEIGGKALWLTHTKQLLEQSKKRAESLLKGDFGTITEGKVNIGKDITFATVQTMSKLNPNLYENEFDMVVVDECHHVCGTPTNAKMFYKVLDNINCRFKYGLSATLTRSDGLIKCVYAMLGQKLYSIREFEVKDKIIKAIHKKIDIDISYNYEDYCGTDGMLDYNTLINTLSNNEERNKIIIDNVVSNFKANKKQLILCHRISQVEYFGKALSTLGGKCSIITGKTKSKDRDFNVDIIVATYQLAKEGLDVPDLDVVHFATPQKDKSTVKQSAGRVERNYEGKQTPYIYDYVDLNIPYCVNCYKKRVNIIKK